ncbi:MAG: DEAD/DEAH box helicase [Candidatus Microsaccharimonas sp.]
MSTFDLLRSEIKTYIWEQGWPSLRPIQEASITHYTNSGNNLILAAPTASGKTEAAFLPAINNVDDWQSGVRIIYISPLIALINDQFKRVTELCEHLNITVTSWHGEASQAQKKKLMKEPEGILLITPESIEAMLVHRPAQAASLFENVDCIIIDELHSFLDSPRGVHLQSLLQRLRDLNKTQPRHIGLSATLSRESYEQAKSFFGLDQETTVLVDSTKNELSISLLHVHNDGKNVPAEIIDDIYKTSQYERMLIFPNARGKVEEIAVRLQRRAKKDQSLVKYFAHHASVDKELRLEAEHFAKAAQDELFTICCTSTLELGIDIGAVDSVCQVDAAPSVASLAQRLGRSGRLKQHSKLHLFTTNGWSLLQTIACTELFREGVLEPINSIKKPYEVLFQQILSILLEKNSLTKRALLNILALNPSWRTIDNEEIIVLINHMTASRLLEEADGELIVGLAAERIIESRSFYAHFENRQEYRVLNDAQHIGDMPRLPTVEVGVNVFLAARIWKITAIDDDTKKMFVAPAKDGKPPIYGGEGGDVSHLVRQTMRQVLLELNGLPDYVSETAKVELIEIYQETGIDSKNPETMKVQKLSNGKEVFATFAGSKINRTLSLMLKTGSDEKIDLSDHQTTISMTGLSQRLNNLRTNPITIPEMKIWLAENPELLMALSPSGKYSRFLPEELLISAAIENILDVEATNDWLQKIEIEFAG